MLDNKMRWHHRTSLLISRTKWKMMLLLLLAASFTYAITIMCWPASTSSHFSRRSAKTSSHIDRWSAKTSNRASTSSFESFAASTISPSSTSSSAPSTTTHITRRPKTLLLHNNEKLCSPSTNETTPFTISIVILVPSRRRSFMQRDLVRQTYGSYRNLNNVRILAVVFVIGGADSPNVTQTDADQIDAEWNKFGDVIMGDFVDSYRNLTTKFIMAYDWLTSYCSDADLLVKTDDDTMMDIFKLTAELSKYPLEASQSFTFWCAIHKGEIIHRDLKNFYHVTYEEYPKERFPTHCAGLGYVTSMRLVRRIADVLSKSLFGPVCRQEDVFITGIVPEYINSNKSEPPIRWVNRMLEWIFYIDKDNQNDDGRYIWTIIDRPVNETVDLDEFRKRSGTRIFYLLQHNSDFQVKFLRLWHFVKNSYRS